MKKLILCSLLYLASVQASFSQCTPNPQYADSTFGFWPDLQAGLPPAVLNIPYLQVIDFVIPTNTSEIIPGFPIPISQAILNNITGLPTGLIWQCNQSDCTYPGGDNGCASLSGTTNDTPGIYPLTISLTVSTGLLGDIPYEVTDYSLTLNSTIGIDEQSKKIFTVSQNSPNPAKDITKIKYSLPSNTAVEISLYDLVGKKIKSEKFFAEKGDREFLLNTSTMEAGIYMYSIKAYDKVITKRMNIVK